jgi:thioredoxin reductase (NADPH)
LTQRITEIPITHARLEQLFPTLSEPQMARVAARARSRATHTGEVLVRPGTPGVSFFVVVSGELETVRPYFGREILILHLDRGKFTGEINTLAGRPALFLTRVAAAGEVLELSRDEMLALVQTDPELSEILMRAFALRRLELIFAGVGDVVLIGSNHSAATLRIKEFLSRNGHPYNYLDVEQDPNVESFLRTFKVGTDEIPVVICRGEVVLRNPTDEELAECLGFNASVDPTELRDLVVIGAGPAGLASAVYGASEGLDVLMLESVAPGGQAGSSSRIENYLGFPVGISGLMLAERAYTQAEKFGAQMLMAKAARLHCETKPYEIELTNGTRIPTRTVVIASGAAYRKPAIENLARFEGAGVYYAATFVEAQLCGSEDVVVVGGANSAGQAAVFLSETARRVYLLIRRGGLSETMSRYLARRIEETPNIVLKPHTELSVLEGGERLESVRWRNNQTGESETVAVGHVFIMAGATPNTAWLHACIALDANGFVKTGSDLSHDDLDAAGWPLARAPYLNETSLPGVFAVGDVRSGSLKRVASAVGEGSITISFVHRVLAQ